MKKILTLSIGFILIGTILVLFSIAFMRMADERELTISKARHIAVNSQDIDKAFRAINFLVRQGVDVVDALQEISIRQDNVGIAALIALDRISLEINGEKRHE